MAVHSYEASLFVHPKLVFAFILDWRFSTNMYKQFWHMGTAPLMTRQKHETGLLHLGEQTKLDALTRHRTISSAARDFA